VIKKPAGSSTNARPTPTRVVGFEDGFSPINKVLREWFYEPDLQATRVLLGCAKAHYLSVGDPAWLFAIAPPGSGKTTMAIMGAAGLPETQMLSSFTSATLLSGFYGKREPGLLEKLGPTTADGKGTQTTEGNAIFLVKDFTTLLSMRREGRGEILAQLREIHDGEFSKTFGTGEKKVWRGRITILAALTPVIDRYYSVFSVLGERFLQLRWHRPASVEAGQRAIEQQGYEAKIRERLRVPIAKLFAESATTPPSISSKSTLRLANLAELVALARTHVFRSSYGNREIEYVPEPEANTRISKELGAIAKGIAALNRHTEVTEQDLQDVFRVGFDCIPDNRRKALLAVAKNESLNNLSIPRTLRDREVQELEALGLITSEKTLTDKASTLLQVADIVADGVKLTA